MYEVQILHLDPFSSSVQLREGLKILIMVLNFGT